MRRIDCVTPGCNPLCSERMNSRSFSAECRRGRPHDSRSGDRRYFCERGLPAESELRARIGVRAKRQSATIILMNTVSQNATEFATVSTMPRIVMPQTAKPAPVDSHGSRPEASWADSAWKQLVARDAGRSSTAPLAGSLAYFRHSVPICPPDTRKETS